MINERVQGCIADTLTMIFNRLDGLKLSGWFETVWNYLMKEITCVGRILETGIWILRHELIGQTSDTDSAQLGQARCP